MADGHVGVFDTAIVFGIDDDGLLGEVGEASAFGADEGNGVKLVLVGPFEGFDEVGRIAADAHGEEDIAGAREVHELFDEDLVVGVVVAEGGDPGGVVIDGHDAEAALQFVGGAFAHVGDEVGGAGSAAAVAEDKDLAIFAPGCAEGFNELGNGIGGNGIEGGFLLGYVMVDPIVHGRMMGIWRALGKISVL
jgi:hypothetical protein